ncbi:MAG: PAS domain S-box protein [Bacteroidetes bacterium]|nr:PAS domain S-box protein [Bacteroidota bacterium]MBU1114941.1 PAS domain S-box protein [Bacteroidota bacterium]MBU1797841.1 PAS domain S-box protein [Bacteroidota bacterium]
MKILIVDDKSENLYLLESLLKASGYETISARNGAEAFGLAKKLKPNIIISDILMPIMDGYAFCLECKKDLDLRNIPFVFYTATYTDPKDEVFSLSLGADRFILKPQDPDVFLEIIKDVLSESKKDKPLLNIPSDLAENTILSEYNSVLIRKLEDKMRQTEENENKLKNYVKELENSIEQQKKTEEALYESEERYRLIFKNSIDAILLTSPDGSIFSANEAACKMFQMTEGEIYHLKSNEIVDLKDRTLPKLLDAQDGLGNARGEMMLVRKDNSKFPADISSFFYTDSSGKIRNCMIIRDITSRKQSEKEIRLLAHSIDSINECVSITDKDNNIIYVNKAFLITYGYAKEELIGKNITLLRPQEINNKIDNKILSKTLNGSWQGELLNQKKDGTIFPISLSTSVIKDENDNIIALIGVAVDITDRKQAEKALRDSEEKFRVIVEATNDALYRLSYSTMKYDYINPAIEKLTGYSTDEINTIGFRNIVVKMKDLSSEDISIYLSERKRMEGETEEWKADYLIKTKNGELKWISDHSFPSYDDDGLLVGSIGVLSDITERELANEEFIKAKENAEEMNRLKSNFLNNMSHELRTPLVSILGFAEFLKEELVNPEHIKMAKDIYSGGKRLSDTLNLILDFSDLDSKNLILTNVDTVVMVNKCIKEFLPMADNKNIKLDLIANTENAFASLDEHIFIGILQRLIDNAIKFTPSGSVTVEINKEIISNKPWISIKVKDTGIGIDESSIDLIYDAFRQGSEGFSRNFDGAGLGLAIAKKCVTSMGGNIDVESKKGVGSVFTVKFPSAENIFDEKNSHHEKSISKENVVLDNKDLPLFLYVENDILTINLVKILLKDVCRLELAENGQQAIKMAQEVIFDGFLMDINLGRGMDGIDVTKEIKKMPQYVNTPFVALTAYAMAKDKEEILEGGCTHYLSKPFNKKELIELIHKVV